MTVDIELPRISGRNPNERIDQIQSYIFRLAEQLNWALNNISGESSANQGSPDMSAVTQEIRSIVNAHGSVEYLSDLSDVSIESPTHGQVLSYDSSLEKFVNADGGGGLPLSVVDGKLCITYEEVI